MDCTPDWYGPSLPHLMRHNGNKGGGQVKAEATKRAITTATRVVSNDDGNGDGVKSNGDGDEGAGQATTRAMAAAMRVASNEEGEGGKAMETVTKLAGKQWRWQQRGQWRWQQGWRVRMWAMARAARAMAMV